MKSLLTLAFALLAFTPISHAMEEADMMAENAVPTVKAVVFYSDSCGSCKILEPKMKKAMKAINMDNVDVVKFDFSNKKAIEATKILADDKGLSDLLQKFGAKTGFVTLLNNDGAIVETIGVNDSVEDIAVKFAKSIVSAS